MEKLGLEIAFAILVALESENWVVDISSLNSFDCSSSFFSIVVAVNDFFFLPWSQHTIVYTVLQLDRIQWSRPRNLCRELC